MKTNFTTLRQVIAVIILSVSFTSTFAQENSTGNSTINNLKATVVNNNVVINWNMTEIGSSEFCQVQASTDGKNFTTIGFVLGADPKQNNNSFAFKQNLAKMKSGNKYYRVVTVGSNAVSVTSEVIKTTI